MKKLLTVCFFLILTHSNAQDLFQESLYSADLVMKNREKISLTDQQAEKIKSIHSQNAGDFSSLKWDLENANSKLKNMLSDKKIDQEAVQKQMNKVLSLENQLKKKKLSTLVAIKNELSESQQSELNHLKGSTHTILSGSVSTDTRVKGTSNYVYNSQGKGVVSVTTSGDGQPLYIVKKDGKEKKVSNINNIDPNLIESVEVLKGSNAIEAHGEEGKNGVVIVTLKKESNYQFE